jgi:AcrR family transcriptional regulator
MTIATQSARAATTKRDYHHRDLKRALAEAAFDIISERGVAAFTWAEACRMAGVSIAAPYRHYPDKQSLYNAVALMAFARLTDALEQERRRAGDDPVARVLSTVDGYLGFAERSPHLLTLLFGSDVDFTPGGPLAFAGQNAIAPLIADIAAAAPSLTEAQGQMVGGNIWIQLHGAATLAINGQLRMPNGDWISARDVKLAVKNLLRP